MSYTSIIASTAPQIPLGELHRIGDVIMQELPNYESRRVCYLKASQGNVHKGQLLGGDFTQSNAGGAGDVMALSGNEKQTITFAADIGAGTFSLRLMTNTGVEVQTAVLANTSTAGDIQNSCNTALNCTTAQWGTVAGNAGAASNIALTFNGTGYTGRAFPLVKVDEIAAFPAADFVSVTKSSVGTPTCISLEQLPASTSIQKILCLVRQATVKPMYLTHDGANTITNADIQQLEAVSNILVLVGPTYNENPDVTDVSRDNSALLTVTNNAIAGI